MNRILITLFILLAAVGCGPHYVDYFPYHDDGTIKPHVVMIPIINSLDKTLPIEADKAMMQAIHYDLMDNGHLFVFSDEETRQGLSKIGNLDFFESDQELVKQFRSADFIVLIELIEHNLAPSSNSNLSQLILKARLKIIDTRCQQPKLVLQEIISRDYLVTGDSGFYCDENVRFVAAVNRSYRWFSTEVARRLEEVILSVH